MPICPCRNPHISSPRALWSDGLLWCEPARGNLQRSRRTCRIAQRARRVRGYIVGIEESKQALGLNISQWKEALYSRLPFAVWIPIFEQRILDSGKPDTDSTNDSVEMILICCPSRMNLPQAFRSRFFFSRRRGMRHLRQGSFGERVATFASCQRRATQKVVCHGSWIWGLIKRFFTWEDYWGQPLKDDILREVGRVTRGHLGADQSIDQPHVCFMFLLNGTFLGCLKGNRIQHQNHRFGGTPI